MLMNPDEYEARLSPKLLYFARFSSNLFTSDSASVYHGVPEVEPIAVEKRCVSISFVYVFCCILLYVYVVLCV